MTFNSCLKGTFGILAGKQWALLRNVCWASFESLTDVLCRSIGQNRGRTFQRPTCSTNVCQTPSTCKILCISTLDWSTSPYGATHRVAMFSSHSMILKLPFLELYYIWYACGREMINKKIALLRFLLFLWLIVWNHPIQSQLGTFSKWLKTWTWW